MSQTWRSQPYRLDARQAATVNAIPKTYIREARLDRVFPKIDVDLIAHTIAATIIQSSQPVFLIKKILTYNRRHRHIRAVEIPIHSTMMRPDPLVTGSS